MNETFLVGSLFDCRLVKNHSQVFLYRTLWRQTMFGCRILEVLIDIFGFKVVYVIQKETFDLSSELIMYNNKSVDIFTRPISLRVDVIELIYPIHGLLDWNFGFTVYRPESTAYYWNFFSNPFSPMVWHCLVIMAIFCSGLFYLTKYWENRLVSGLIESSYGYEMLMIVGGYCQHIPPIDAVLYSRRGVYLTFFIFAYIIYTYYASNLLSHLVNDKDESIKVDMILNSGVDCVILEDQMWIIMNFVSALLREDSNNNIYNKLRNMKSVNMTTGLELLRTRNAALMSDYVSIEPFIHSVFENDEICALKNVDVISDIKKYYYVSKDFPYKEEFKVAFMRMQETGILDRLYKYYITDKIECGPLTHVQTYFKHIQPVLFMLFGAYVLCSFILLMEIMYYNRTRVWPYVD